MERPHAAGAPVEGRRIEIRGTVQGVGFRLWLRNVANSLNLAGSCRQLPEGPCEAVIQGEQLHGLAYQLEEAA